MIGRNTLDSITTQDPKSAGDLISRKMGRSVNIKSIKQNTFAANLTFGKASTLNIMNAHFMSGAEMQFPNSVDNLAAYVISSGELLIEIDGRHYKVASNEIILINERGIRTAKTSENTKLHNFVFSQQDVQAMIEIMIGRPAAFSYLAMTHLSADSAHFRRLAAIIGAIDSSMDEVQTEYKTSKAINLLCDTILIAMIEALPFYQKLASEAPTASIGPRQLQRAVDYIRGSTGPVAVHQLANDLGIGVRALQISFKKYFGLTPHAYIKQARLHGARGDLVDPHNTLSIKQVARHWGFLNAGQFAADFQDAYGETPSAAKTKSKK